MNDDVAGVDQHPIAVRHAFDAGVNAEFAQIFDYSIGNRSDMAMRSAGRHDHIVAHGRSISKIDCEGVLGLHVVEAVED